MKNELRHQFYELWKNVLNIPKLNRQTVIIIDKYAKGDYDWEIMLDALKAKEVDMRKHINKGEPYVFAIWRNQLNVSNLKIKQQREREQKMKKLNESYIYEDRSDNEFRTTTVKGDISSLF